MSKCFFKMIEWNSVGLNYTQRLRVWLVAFARSKLVKENEPEENP